MTGGNISTAVKHRNGAFRRGNGDGCSAAPVDNFHLAAAADDGGRFSGRCSRQHRCSGPGNTRFHLHLHMQILTNAFVKIETIKK